MVGQRTRSRYRSCAFIDVGGSGGRVGGCPTTQGLLRELNRRSHPRKSGATSTLRSRRGAPLRAPWRPSARSRLTAVYLAPAFVRRTVAINWCRSSRAVNPCHGRAERILAARSPAPVLLANGVPIAAALDFAGKHRQSGHDRSAIFAKLLHGLYKRPMNSSCRMQGCFPSAIENWGASNAVTPVHRHSRRPTYPDAWISAAVRISRIAATMPLG